MSMHTNQVWRKNNIAIVEWGAKYISGVCECVCVRVSDTAVVAPVSTADCGTTTFIPQLCH